LSDRLLEAGVRVGDDELDAGQAALNERSQEASPEVLALALADVESDRLPIAGLMHCVSEGSRERQLGGGERRCSRTGSDPPSCDRGMKPLRPAVTIVGERLAERSAVAQLLDLQRRDPGGQTQARESGCWLRLTVHRRMEGRMHAVVVRVRIDDFETARKHLRDEVVPSVSKAPGFTGGYWTRSEDGGNGMAMVLFESEEAARGAVDPIRSNATEGVTLESVEVREVVEHA
jgi:hypothetical protein